MGKSTAEDVPSYRTCKRGHPRIPDNLYMPSRSCKECHRITDRAAHARYRERGKGRLIDAHYNASTKGWAAARRYHLKGAREAIQVKLEALEKEKAECLRLLERAIAKKLSEQGQST